MSRLAVGAVAGTLLLCLASPAVGQDNFAQVPRPGGSSDAFEADAVVDPAAAEEPGTTPEGDPPNGTEPIDDQPDVDLDQNTSNTEIQTPGYGNAADQPPEAKQQEIRAVQSACQSKPPPPTSTMLSLPGSAGGDEDASWGLLLIAVAVVLLVLAAIGFGVKHRGSQRIPIVALSTAATAVGVVSALTGLAVQLIPGVGVSDPPPPEATMEVRQVHPRITRNEYARKTRSNVLLSPQDRREVGNVIWVEIQFRGYQDRRPSLQYALYDSQAAGALLPGTAKRVPLRLRGKDVETLFVPIWVGYPRSRFFEAQFRLLDGGQVQQMASTGKMAGSTYRYTCRKSA
jgi:hypothetical protein